MLRTRVIPALLLHGKSLVKTERFGKYQYIGDPANTVRIFNELEVDELSFLDIKAARTRSSPDFDVLRDIATECFMPLSYGGGIDSLEMAKRVFDTGFEKIIVNTAAYVNPKLITEIAQVYGSQAVMVSIDLKRGLFGGLHLASGSGRVRQKGTATSWSQEMEQRGAGEILITSVDREGTWSGFDLDLVKEVSGAVDIPVIAHGGAGKLSDLTYAVCKAGASAVAVGSMVVFQKKGMGVLVNFPSPENLATVFSEPCFNGQRTD
jgi:cyclase